MSAKHDNGGAAAFPGFHTHSADGAQLVYPISEPGMSLRAYMATAAMQGELASQTPDAAFADSDAAALAKRCVCFADALLSELAKEGGE